MKSPDVVKHFIISYAKSIIRIITCIIAYMTHSIEVLCIGLAMAEVLGLLEELL